MSQSVKGETLAVEIFVTNAKDELGKNKRTSIGLSVLMPLKLI
jgi:hypothetical protein